ncbi:MAG: hypothetical protein JWN86_989 [Planctomycetota bacterium]|nr:hypothetical protein [Planctomycetota bacterium]
MSTVRKSHASPDLSPAEEARLAAEREALVAECLKDLGPIPPSCRDESGRMYSLDDPGYQARRAEYKRLLEEKHARMGPVPEDPPGWFEQFMQDIDDERRSAGMRTLFEGQY